MTKDVIISISGLQFAEEIGKDPVEVVVNGEYYFKNGKHYVVFDEVMEGFKERTKSVMKFKDDLLDITKKGLTNVHMIFEENKKNLTYYGTPFGNLLIGISTKNVELKEREEALDLTVGYTLEVNYEYLADCLITMNIKSKDAKEFSLQ